MIPVAVFVGSDVLRLRAVTVLGVLVAASCAQGCGAGLPASGGPGGGTDRDRGESSARSNAGRPAPGHVDTDQDGVPDAADLCPAQAEDRDGHEDADGCPDLDNDGDLIADECDLCPNQQELFNGWSDDDGCPDRGVDHVPTRFRAGVVPFRRRQSRLEQDGEAALDAIVATFERHWSGVELVGCVDVDERRPQLAAERASVVRELLLERGLPADLVRVVHEPCDPMEHVPHGRVVRARPLVQMPQSVGCPSGSATDVSRLGGP